MKHVFEAYHQDVYARISATDVTHEGYSILRGANVDNRTILRWRSM